MVGVVAAQGDEGGREVAIIRCGLVTLVSSLPKRSMTITSICDPSKVRFSGPLAPFASGLAAELDAMGYATTSTAEKLRLAAHLSRWLEAQHLEAGDLTGPVIDRFLVVRRRDCTKLYSAQALGPMLEYLRRVNAAPPPSLPLLPSSASDAVLIRFRNYLMV